MIDYLSYWSLSVRPFADSATGRFFWGPPQREVMAGVTYLASGQQRAAVLATDRGCGATSLLRQLAETSGLGDTAVEVVWTDGNQLSRNAVLAELAKALGLPVPSRDVEQQLGLVLEAAGRGSVETIWMIDHCQLPAARLAGQLITRWPNFRALVVGREAAADRFARLLSGGDEDRRAVRMTLDPLSLEETADYVRDSLLSAGGSDDWWTDSAVIRLYEFGGGRIGRMSADAEAAMMLAARHGLRSIGPDLIEAASQSRANRRAA